MHSKIERKGLMAADIGVIPKIFLKSGQIYISHRPVKVSTILGSCISVTMFNKRNHLGMICHALLPNDNGQGSYKYVDSSIARMVKEFHKCRIARDQIEVKLFGGAVLIFPEETSNSFISVGRQNIYSAYEVLAKLGLNLTSADVGGNYGRRIDFFTHTGKVCVNRHDRITAKDEIISFLDDKGKIVYKKF